MHELHGTVVTLVEPLLKRLLCLAEFGIGDPDLLKSQRQTPAFNALG